MSRVENPIKKEKKIITHLELKFHDNEEDHGELLVLLKQGTQQFHPQFD